MAVKKFFSTKVSNLTKYSKDVVQYEYVKEQNQDFKNTAIKIFGTKEILKNAKTESFNDARERLGLTEFDILELYKGLSISFYTYVVITLLLFFFSIYILFFLKNLISALVIITLIGVCLANCFKYSFRSFQVKNRKLCPVNDWYSSKDYFPEIISGSVVSNSLNSQNEDLEERIKLEKQSEEELEKEKNIFQAKLKALEDEYDEKSKREKKEAAEFLAKLRSENLIKDNQRGDL